MPSYHQLITSPGGPQRLQNRMQLLKRIESVTGRPLIVYAANMKVANIPNSIDHTDVTPFANLTETVPGRKLDIMIQSPGGLAEAAERIVHLLRARFDDVRFVVMHTAFSAATMLCMSANCLILDDTSALGPIDPQILYRDPNTGQLIPVPTQAITAGFHNARQAIKDDPDVLPVYVPLLNKLDLHLFEICKNAETLSTTLVLEWLKGYMFKGDPEADTLAQKAAAYLSSHKDRLSHSRPITIEAIKHELKLKTLDLREDPKLRPLLVELWAEVEWFIDNSDTAKFFENAYGVAFRRRYQMEQQIILQPVTAPPQPPPQKPPGAVAGK